MIVPARLPASIRHFLLAGMIAIPLAAHGADQAAAPGNDAGELAKQLSNPVASLISVPIQMNWDFGAGPTGGGTKFYTNIQPVVPITLTKDINLIIRTILPIIDQHGVAPTYNSRGVYVGSSQAGLGDTVQSFFISPSKPLFGSLILGIGPAFNYPTASSNFLGTGKWAIGPTLVALVQTHGFTIGVLTNNLSSFADGRANRAPVNALFLQPFVSYQTKSATTFTLNTESTYDWNAKQWTVPINLGVSQVFKIGKQPVSAYIGGRYYAESPPGGPDWGLRFVFTLLLPKGHGTTASPTANVASSK